MSLRKDHTVYSGTFRNLKLRAWGFDQIIRETFVITIHQVRAHPARWIARPRLTHADHDWSGRTAAAVMQMVSVDFEECISPFSSLPDQRGARPSLRSAADIGDEPKQA